MKNPFIISLILCLALILSVPARADGPAVPPAIYRDFLAVCQALELLTPAEAQAALEAPPLRAAFPEEGFVSYAFHPFAGISSPKTASLPALCFEIHHTLDDVPAACRIYNYQLPAEDYPKDTLPIEAIVAFLHALSDERLPAETLVQTAAQLRADVTEALLDGVPGQSATARFDAARYDIAYHLFPGVAQVSAFPKALPPETRAAWNALVGLPAPDPDPDPDANKV